MNKGMKRVLLEDLPVLEVSHDEMLTKQVMLTRGDMPHLTHFSVTLLSQGQTTTPHLHKDLHEAFFVASGEGKIRVNATEHYLEQGVLVTVEPGEVHEISNIGSSDLVLIYFGLEE